LFHTVIREYVPLPPSALEGAELTDSEDSALDRLCIPSGVLNTRIKSVMLATELIAGFNFSI